MTLAEYNRGYGKLPQKECFHCGKKFQMKHPRQKFCSGLCQYRNHIDGTFSIFLRDSFTCIYCGKSSLNDGVKLEIDHITPKIKGGSNHIDNLVTACAFCNASKQGRELPLDVSEKVHQIVKLRNTF